MKKIRLALPAITTGIGRYAMAITEAIVRAATKAAHQLTNLWRTHEELMETSDLYGALVIAVTAALARQVSLHRLVLAIISALMRAYGATRGRANPTRRLPNPFDDTDDHDDGGWAYA